MTKKDFIIIATILKSCHDKAAWCFDNDEDYKRIVNEFVQALFATNIRFDARKFREFCNSK